jgi:PAS domain S-box-containing protein
MNAGTTGVLGRWMLGTTLVVPPLLGWAVLTGEDAGLYGERLGAALLVCGHVCAFTAVTFVALVVGRRIEVAGIRAERQVRQNELLQAFMDHTPSMMFVKDLAGRYLVVNTRFEKAIGLRRGQILGRRAEDILPAESAAPASAAELDMLAQGTALQREGLMTLPGGPRYFLTTLFPLNDRSGAPYAICGVLTDTTELQTLSSKAEVAQERLNLLHQASADLGTTLDVTRTGEKLAELTVGRFADFTTVDLAEPVLRGEEPFAGSSATSLHRVAVSGIRGDHPLRPAGEQLLLRAESLHTSAFGSGKGKLVADLGTHQGWRSLSPVQARKALKYGLHSLITVPLRARGLQLGIANFWRGEGSPPFEEDDLSIAREMVARAALGIDNARRYTREHTMAVTLQHSLLPRGLAEQNAVEVAHRYQPAQAGVGGDWFDIIPLPGFRVALVIGDVVGHGLRAAATMGRLRTAIHNFSTLDLPPDELLGHLDELVKLIDEEETAAGGTVPVAGATCLYAIYDPVSRSCSMARAGHLPPVIVLPDGTVEHPELPAGPPLGLGGLLFERIEFQLPEGSQLVLYTDGLIQDRERDIDTGLRILRQVLTHADRSPEQTCQALFDQVLPRHPIDDIALLVGRTKVMPSDQVAEWDVPFDPAAVRQVRAAVSAQLSEWHLDASLFTTELILSELVTNAIRYGASPIHVRLLRERSLVCEVSDASSTAPHLRYASTTEEGGRGLFLVAQFAERWGTRYTETGKIIWADQTLDGAVPEW